MPHGEARGQNVRHLGLFFFLFFLYGIIQFEQQAPFRVFLSVISDERVSAPSMTPQPGVHVPLRALFLVVSCTRI